MAPSQLGSRKKVKSRKESNSFSRTKKSFAYDSAFEQHLIDHDVYSYEYDYNDDDEFVYLDNWEEINDRLA